MVGKYVFRSVIFDSSKQIGNALAKIDGIGQSRASYIIDSCGYSRKIKLNRINSYGFTLMALIANRFYIVSEDLNRMRTAHFKALEELNSYKALKWKEHLPIRGQLTKTNAKTSKKSRAGYKRISKRRDKKKTNKLIIKKNE